MQPVNEISLAAILSILASRREGIHYHFVIMDFYYA